LAAALRQKGKKALAENRLEDALAAYHQAVDADQSNPISLIYLGEVYLRAHRHREAIPILERAMGLTPSEGSGVPFMLARAYIGINDENRAVATLRRAGMSEQRIPGEIAKLRDIVNQNLRQE